MARLLSQTGQTAKVTIGSPTEGMKWIVKWALVILHTGTGTGTRSAQLIVYRANNTLGSGPVLATTNNQTGTSANFPGGGDVTSQFWPSNGTTFYQFPEVFAVDVIQSDVTLISGDTYDYYIMVEEASS